MSELLLLEHVTKRFSRSAENLAVLDELSLSVAPGEIVAVRGRRRSGRTTLLRIAAGIDHADSGTLTFAGKVVTDRRVLRASCSGFAYPRLWEASMGPTLADQVGLPLIFRRGSSPPSSARNARREGIAALAAVGIGELASASLSECRRYELLLAAIARATVTRPRLLICDELLTEDAVNITDRVLDLLRGFAREGMAVLVSTDVACKGADRSLILHSGKLYAGSLVPV